jgi:hypothetical protein
MSKIISIKMPQQRVETPTHNIIPTKQGSEATTTTTNNEQRRRTNKHSECAQILIFPIARANSDK